MKAFCRAHRKMRAMISPPLPTFEEVALGKRCMHEVLGVSVSTIQALTQLASSAFIGGRYEQAAQIYAGLELLDATCATHSLCLAHARSRAGQHDDALFAV